MSEQVSAHLSQDVSLKNIITNWEIPVLKRTDNIALYLCLSIISQQLSTKVARVISDRFLDLYQGKEPTCELVLNTETDVLRSVGMSMAKANYLHNVCTFFIENRISDTTLHRMKDHEILDLLTRIKGVGNWTVEMLLMFALGREDIFAVDDLGVQQAMIAAYGLPKEPKKILRSEMLRISKAWSPYRTYGCIALWQWKDRKRVD